MMNHTVRKVQTFVWVAPFSKADSKSKRMLETSEEENVPFDQYHLVLL